MRLTENDVVAIPVTILLAGIAGASKGADGGSQSVQLRVSELMRSDMQGNDQ